ncbi:hypothetical protein [Halobacterium zhouii]|uniref:hypothetical protein n=1 Tax=Halobacterium zhouii TaxID=2902624 RepID=UPI001E389279|nr:hypothetical protein [Halobacterium zhouii]
MSEIGILKEILGGATDYYEYWKDYKGERICIRQQTIAAGGKSRGSVKQNIYIIEGTVSNVTSYPPGFLLTEVEEYVQFRDTEISLSAGNIMDAIAGVNDKQVLREVDEKYVSFDAIEEIEPKGASEAASIPFK